MSNFYIVPHPVSHLVSKIVLWHLYIISFCELDFVGKAKKYCEYHNLKVSLKNRP